MLCSVLKSSSAVEHAPLPDVKRIHVFLIASTFNAGLISLDRAALPGGENMPEA